MRKNAIRLIVATILVIGMSSVQLWAASSQFPPPMVPPVPKPAVVR
jgi:hypothetical protein